MFKAYRLSGRADLLADSKNLDALARAAGLIQRVSQHFSAAAFLLAMLQAVATASPALRSIANLTGGLLKKSLTKQALHRRFSEATSAFLLGVAFRLLLDDKLAPSPPTLGRFRRIVVEDSTQHAFHKRMAHEFPAHGNGKGETAGCKINFAFDLVSHQAVNFGLWPATTQDKEIGKELLDLLEPGDLLLRDMGYFDSADLTELKLRGIYWISRLPANTSVTNEDGEALEKILAKAIGDRIDITVLVTKEKRPMRLVAVRADKQTVAERRRELRANAKARGTTVAKTSLARTSWHLLLTNVPADMADAQELGRLYGLRWRIETLFRSWKRDKQWTRALRHVSNRWHLEALVLAGLIQGLLSMAMVETVGKAERGVRLSLEKVHDALRQSLGRMDLTGHTFKLAAAALPNLKLESRKREATYDQLVKCLG